ncbi:hypothetical protein SSYM_1816 [Serratia symbiotica str. Tucson]|uniref:Uncharacterized protein n=2 Tax=Serratia symbiotica TaxID=138074 RepID=E9CMS0_9GAMM|nr:hypothetical protein SSYM_1816 [Serratia symbiotica str. Tucson]CDG48093.1 hypothetical protein SCTVLC_1391 [Serratia symbiotica SCt-VLC]
MLYRLALSQIFIVKAAPVIVKVKANIIVSFILTLLQID